MCSTTGTSGSLIGYGATRTSSRGERTPSEPPPRAPAPDPLAACTGLPNKLLDSAPPPVSTLIPAAEPGAASYNPSKTLLHRYKESHGEVLALWGTGQQQQRTQQASIAAGELKQKKLVAATLASGGLLL